jgi:hypothetical protein
MPMFLINTEFPKKIYAHKVNIPYFMYIHVALGGVVVSVLATGPKVRGFKPGRG